MGALAVVSRVVKWVVGGRAVYNMFFTPRLYTSEAYRRNFETRKLAA